MSATSGQLITNPTMGSGDTVQDSRSGRGRDRSGRGAGRRGDRGPNTGDGPARGGRERGSNRNGGRGRGGRERGGYQGAMTGPNDGRNITPADGLANPAARMVGGQEPMLRSQNDEEEVEAEVCFICASPVVHNSVAPCNHRTCHICALRLRALYKTKACAHCRVGLL